MAGESPQHEELTVLKGHGIGTFENHCLVGNKIFLKLGGGGAQEAETGGSLSSRPTRTARAIQRNPALGER